MSRSKRRCRAIRTKLKATKLTWNLNRGPTTKAVTRSWARSTPATFNSSSRPPTPTSRTSTTHRPRRANRRPIHSLPESKLASPSTRSRPTTKTSRITTSAHTPSSNNSSRRPSRASSSSATCTSSSTKSLVTSTCLKNCSQLTGTKDRPPASKVDRTVVPLKYSKLMSGI